MNIPLKHQIIDKALNLGLSPLPVAPKQPQNTRFSGKNPSFLDTNGIPRLISHEIYQKTQPTHQDLDMWSNPDNGVGTLLTDDIVCIDIDCKNFESQLACDNYFNQLLEVYPILKSAWIEQTQSGGYHIIIKLKSPKTFTNFSDRPGGKQIGEVLGYGRFAVLAPTIGPSGNPYTCLNFPDELPEIESLESLNIYPSSSKKARPKPKGFGEVQAQSLLTETHVNNSEIKQKPKSSVIDEIKEIDDNQSVYLIDLISENNRRIYDGEPVSNDKSESLATLLNELYGWVNWCNENNIPIIDNARDLAIYAGGKLGIDGDKINRIIDGHDSVNCHPAIFSVKGDDGCCDKIKQARTKRHQKTSPKPTKNNDKNRVEITQIAEHELHRNDFLICHNNELYKWVGSHYELIPDADELRIIRDFCDNFVVWKGKEQKETYPYANPKTVETILKWIKIGNAISPQKTLNKGINCINGVLVIDWVDNKPVPKLEPHDPNKHYFLEAPQIIYDPLAISTDCDRLLSCLDPASQEILIRNLGASLDLKQVRKLKGRAVKMLFCIGGGSNGKDSIREVVSIIYGGKGMTGKSLDDFATYDDGRKYTLADLHTSRINWASESGKTTRLDNSKSLKAFATGDTLQCERKFQQEFDFRPEAIGLFNLNEMPNIYATGQAAEDRFAPIKFSKTFVNQDKFDKNNSTHILADPRFKYDSDFIKNNVASAFLNRMIKGLQNLIEYGIDYSSTEELMNEIREDNNHLFEFVSDTGLVYQEGSEVPINKIWLLLEEWYKSQGIFEDNNYGRTWLDPVKPSDKYIKGANQVLSRFLALFPKAQKCVTTITENGRRKQITIIKGIHFDPDSTREAKTEKQKKIDNIESQETAKNLVLQIRELIESNHINWGACLTVFGNSTQEIKDLAWEQFTDKEKQILKKLQPENEAEKAAKKILDAVKTGNKSQIESAINFANNCNFSNSDRCLIESLLPANLKGEIIP